MIIEAKDGRYYTNPLLLGPHSVLEVQDEYELRLLVLKGTSIKKGCEELGIKIKRPAIIQTIRATWPTGVVLEVAQVCDAHLKDPIPVPTQHKGVTDYCLAGDPLVCWSMPFSAELISKIMAGELWHEQRLCRFLEVTPKTIRRKLNRQDLTPKDGLVTLRRKDAYVY